MRDFLESQIRLEVPNGHLKLLIVVISTFGAISNAGIIIAAFVKNAPSQNDTRTTGFVTVAAN
jgi:hypothetical protein